MTITEHPNLIGGEPAASVSGEWLDSVDPATGRVWARVPAGDERDIDTAVAAASAAAPGWNDTPPSVRADLIRRWAVAVREHADELWRTDATDNGRPRVETEGAVLGAAPQMEYHAGLAETISGRTVNVSPTASTYTLRQPYGVVGLIVPWNAPLAMFLSKVTAAIAAGNTIVVKPPELAAVSTLAAATLLDEIGMPPGVVNVVVGEGRSAGAALAAHPDVRMLSFTGSTQTGRSIVEASTGNLKALSLELGGKSPHIVFDDADLDRAVASLAAGIFTASAGQACIAGSRILVQSTVYDDVVARVSAIAGTIALGDPLDAGTGMGPVISGAQFAKIRRYIDEAVEVGAVLVCGGRSGAQVVADAPRLADGNFIEPTLIATDDPTAAISREEVFGPVGVVTRFEDEDDAVRIANDTEFGLAAGVWTSDLGRAHRMINRLDAGTVWVNAYRRLHWALPFGGHRTSGIGVSNGPDALAEWLEDKTAWIEHG